MTTLFDELLLELVEPNVDRIYAEDFELTPTSGTPNGRQTFDPTRPVITGKGVFINPSAAIGIQMGVRKTYREANDLRAITSGEDAYLSVDLRYFGTLEHEPRQGDFIALTQRSSEPGYQVVSVERDGLTRLRLKMVQRSDAL